MTIKEKQRLRTNGETEPYTKSIVTDMGYLLMLIFRFGIELWFLYVENQLGKHQSQKADFWDSFNLKEYWMCPTQPDAAAVSATIPVEQRSELFWVDEVNEACQQQTVEVRCWIPFSWMKTYWILQKKIQVFRNGINFHCENSFMLCGSCILFWSFRPFWQALSWLSILGLYVVDSLRKLKILSFLR